MKGGTVTGPNGHEKNSPPFHNIGLAKRHLSWANKKLTPPPPRPNGL